MNVRWLLLITIITVAVSAPCRAAESLLPQVNGKAIPQSRFDNMLRSATAGGSPDTPELRNAITEELVAREVLAQEAMKRGLDKLPEFAAALEEQRSALLVQAFLLDHLRRNPVSDDAVRKEYDRLVAANPTQQHAKFEEVAAQVRLSLEQQAVQQAVGTLRKQTKVQ